MIRDPSDGSVREKPAKTQVSVKPPRVPEMVATGLPPIDKDKTNETARLKRSREWLEEYRKRRGAQ